MKFQLAINLERMNDGIDLKEVASRTLEMVQMADDGGFHIDEIKVASFIETQFVRLVNLGLYRGASVAGISEFASSSNRGDQSRREVDAPNSMRVDFTNVEGAVWSYGEAVGVAESCFGGWSVVARVAGNTRASERGDLRGDKHAAR